MTMKWYLIVWLISADGEWTPGYEVDGWGDRLQPSLEVCLERKDRANSLTETAHYECFGYFTYDRPEVIG